MELGIGTDIVHIKKFIGFKNEKKLLKRIFTKAEIEYCQFKAKPAEHFAARFAAKEALKKALAKFNKNPDFIHIEIVHDKSKRPVAKIRGCEDFDIDISLSHDKEYALAFALVRKSKNKNEYKRKSYD